MAVKCHTFKHSEVWIIFLLNSMAKHCLLNDTLPMLKECNVYIIRLSTHHNIPNSWESNSKKKLQNLKCNVSSQQNFVTKNKNEMA